MTTQVDLQHGDRETRLSTPPAIGQRYDGKNLTIDVVPSRSYEVNFRSDKDVLSMGCAPITGLYAYDTDKVRPLKIQPYTAAFHPAGTTTYVRGEKVDGEFFAVAIDPAIRANIAEEMKRPDLAGDRDVMDGLVLSDSLLQFQMLRRFTTQRSGGGSLAAESLGILFLTSVLSTLPGPALRIASNGGLSDKSLSLLFDVIEASLSEDISLVELARVVELTPHHFARTFKKATGFTPHQYVLERRVARAREMLVQPDNSLADVAYATGFSSQAHMTDVFRKRLGITPGAYRLEKLE